MLLEIYIYMFQLKAKILSELSEGKETAQKSQGHGRKTKHRDLTSTFR